MQKIKCVTFDLDDTLWPVAPIIEKANQALWGWLSDNVPAFTAKFQMHDLFQGSALWEQLIEREPHIAYSISATRIRLLESGFQQVGLNSAEASHCAKIAFQYFLSHRQKVEPYAEVVPLLNALKSQGLKIGALTNGNADIKQTSLAQWFDFQFNADDVGTAKPDPLMFEKALALMQLKPHQMLHVGDHPINDVAAAQAIGIKSLWVNPERAIWPQHQAPKKTAIALKDIPTVAELNP